MQKQVEFSEAAMTKYPELVHIVLAEDERGICNPMSASWAMFTSIEPLMMAVSVGYERHSYEVIRKAGEFIIAYPSERMEAEVRFFGSESGRDMDKLAEFGEKTQPAVSVKGRLLSDATANFECRITGELKTGDHAIFAGEVVAAHMNVEQIGRLYVLQRRKFGAWSSS